METLADALRRAPALSIAGVFHGPSHPDVADSVLAGSLRADVEEIADGANFDPEEARPRHRGPLMRKTPFGSLMPRRPFAPCGSITRCCSPIPKVPSSRPTRHASRAATDFDSSGLTFISPTALDAERVYRQLGIKPSGHSNESADHMGVETEFLGLVYEQLAGAVDDSGDEERPAARQPSWRTSTAAIS